MLRFVRAGLALAASFVLVSCGGGGGAGTTTPSTTNNTTTNTSNSTTSNSPGAVPTGTPVVFLAASSSSSSFVPGFNLTLQTDTQNIIRYVPATGAATYVDSNQSPSFARSTLYPFTQGDKYFHLDVSLDINQFFVYPMNLQTNARGSGVRVQLDPFPTRCMAVVGDDLYYRDPNGGAWKRVANISTAGASATTVVMETGSTVERCTFNLGSGMGRLFDVEFVDASGTNPDSIFVRERSLATGRVLATLGSFSVTATPQNFDSYRFAFDGSLLYMVRRSTAGQVELWRYDLTNPTGPMTLRSTLVPAAPVASVSTVDVHNGFVGMLVSAGGTGKLLTYNDVTNGFRELVVGNEFYDVQVLNLP